MTELELPWSIQHKYGASSQKSEKRSKTNSVKSGEDNLLPMFGQNMDMEERIPDFIKNPL